MGRKPKPLTLSARNELKCVTISDPKAVDFIYSCQLYERDEKGLKFIQRLPLTTGINMKMDDVDAPWDAPCDVKFNYCDKRIESVTHKMKANFTCDFKEETPRWTDHWKDLFTLTCKEVS